jgi:hypothetical protein
MKTIWIVLFLFVSDLALSQTLSVSVTSTEVRCVAYPDGTASIIATGGTTPYSYNWNSGQTTSTIEGLIAAVYSCTVADALFNTESISVTVTSNYYEELSLITEDTIGICLGNTAQVCAQAEGGNSSYNFIWSNGYVSSGNETTCIQVNETATTKYKVILSDGCMSNDTAEVLLLIYPGVVPDCSVSVIKEGCVPLTVLFTACPSAPGTIFEWDVNSDGTIDTISSYFEWTYTEVGLYSLEITAKTVMGCEYVIPLYNYIHVLDSATNNCSVGINNPFQQNNNILAYPNPFTNNLTIHVNLGDYKHGLIVLYDIQGKQIQEYSIVNQLEILELTTDQLQKGVYFYQFIADGEQLSTEKIVKL